MDGRVWHQEAMDGREAALLLENPILRRAFEQVELVHIQRWRDAQSLDEREAQWQGVTAIRRLRAQLHQCVVAGKMAEWDIQQQEGGEHGA